MRRLAAFLIVMVSAPVAVAEINRAPTTETTSLEISAVRGSYQFVEPPSPDNTATQSSLSYVSDSGKVVIYLNREGGVFSPGKNDSRENTTSLVEEPTVMPAYAGTDERWQDVMSCVRDQFAGFRVEITDTDPGDIRHYEAVVSGEPGHLDQPDHIGGLSPFRLDCGIIDNSIVFIFADLFGDQTDRMCDVIAQEVAHSFGLDHQMNCDDPMSYMSGCGEKRFRNMDAACGEYDERMCACGQETQNSRVLLGQHLGDTASPELRIASPADGASVNPYFYVDVRAEDNIKVERVELYANGSKVASKTEPPFVFEFDGQLGDGEHQLEARVYDAENQTTQRIAVNVDATAALQPPPPSEPMGVGPLKDVEGGCNAAGRSVAPAPLAAALLAGVLLLALRRPRRSRCRAP